MGGDESLWKLYYIIDEVTLPFLNEIIDAPFSLC